MKVSFEKVVKRNETLLSTIVIGRELSFGSPEAIVGVVDFCRKYLSSVVDFLIQRDLVDRKVRHPPPYMYGINYFRDFEDRLFFLLITG